MNANQPKSIKPVDHPWYPGDVPTNQAHLHWSICWGQPRMKMTDEYQTRLAQYIVYIKEGPKEQDKKSLEFWTDERTWAAVWAFLFEHFGVRDHFAIFPKESKALGYYQLDPDAVLQSLGCDFPEWYDWINSFTKYEQRTQDLSEKLNLPHFDRAEQIWRAGNDCFMRIGHRMKPTKNCVGRTDFDRFLDTLTKVPEWRSSLDIWANDLARSKELSNAISSGMVVNRSENNQGYYVVLPTFTMNEVAVAKLFNISINNETNSAWKHFRERAWTQIREGLLRESLRRREELIYSGAHVDVGAYSPARIVPIAADVSTASLAVILDSRRLRESIGMITKGELGTLSLDSEDVSTVEYVASSPRVSQATLFLVEEMVNYVEEVLSPARDVLITHASSMEVDELDDSPYVPLRLTTLDKPSTRRMRGPAKVGADNEDIGTLEDHTEEGLSPPGDAQSHDIPDTGTTVLPIQAFVSPPRVTSTDYQIWHKAVNAQVDSILKQKRPDFVRLVESISAQVRERVLIGRQAKLKPKIFSPFLANATQAKLQSNGYSPATDFTRIDESLFADNLWSIGRLLDMHSAELPDEFAITLVNDFASLLALSTLSSTATIFAPLFESLVDVKTREVASRLPTPSARRNAFALTHTIGNFFVGAYLALCIGHLPRDRSAANMGKWVKALLCPEAALNPNGSRDWRLECIACDGNEKLLLPQEAIDQYPSGLQGLMRGVNLSHRLSVTNYAVRRSEEILLMAQVSRLAFYPCLWILFWASFHPSLILLFLCFASLIHRAEKGGKGKTMIILTRKGYILKQPYNDDITNAVAIGSNSEGDSA